MYQGPKVIDQKITLAQADAFSTSFTTIGVVTNLSIANNAMGYVTTHGLVNGLNTSAFLEGDVLWLSPTTAGGITNVEPTSTQHKVHIGHCIVSHTTQGRILVTINFDRNKFGNIPAGNYTEFEDDGTAVARGSAATWEDIDFPIIIRTTGNNVPTITAINGNLTMPQWAVNDFAMSESQEFIHKWKEGSTCYWHIHLNTNGLDTTDRFVRFSIEYGYTAGNSLWSFPAVFTTPDILIPANTPSKTQIIMPLTNFTPTGSRIGGHVVARLTRVASTGLAPTNNPWIPMLQMHVLCDTNGSREMTTK